MKKRFFADSSYWIALLNANDSLHSKALSVSIEEKYAVVYTTDAVFMEVLNQYSGRGTSWRKKTVERIRRILNDPNVINIPLDHSLFLEGLDLYESRIDKEYSQVDCISMIVMRRENIIDILISDHHFAQEGFNILLRT